MQSPLRPKKQEIEDKTPSTIQAPGLAGLGSDGSLKSDTFRHSSLSKVEMTNVSWTYRTVKQLYLCIEKRNKEKAISTGFWRRRKARFLDPFTTTIKCFVMPRPQHRETKVRLCLIHSFANCPVPAIIIKGIYMIWQLWWDCMMFVVLFSL